MSDTDKTKPPQVRVHEHRPWREEHNHIDGQCNLPKSPLQGEGWTPQGCYYSDWPLWRGEHCCWGWKSRAEGYWERLENRQDRHRARAALRSGDWDRL